MMKKLLASGALMLVTDDQGKGIALGRTPTGQFFYDVVMSKKTPKWLAAKWRLPIAEIRELRARGRGILRGRKRSNG